MTVYHDEVEIEDFEFDEETEMYYYPCPCGDRFEISKVCFFREYKLFSSYVICGKLRKYMTCK